MRWACITLLSAWTYAAFALNAASECSQCHAEIARKQAASRHAQTLVRFEKSRLAGLLAASSPIELDGYRFEYRPSSVTVHRNTERVSATLEWAFGAGAYGMTAVGQYEGLFYEHRVSYYIGENQPGITPGHASGAPRTAADALGVLKLPQDIYRCFDCHSTGLAAGADGAPDLSNFTPGILCERCHGAGQQHAGAARAGAPADAIRKALFNPGRLPAKALIEFCGGCHRLPDPAHPSLMPEIQNPLSVRFQPAGLMASRCFRESQSLSCITCHDPHEDAVRKEPEFYIGKCLACHSSTNTATSHCKRNERADCMPCHMRRATPLPHLAFTDHRIRIYPE